MAVGATVKLVRGVAKDEQFADSLASGRLVRLLPDWSLPGAISFGAALNQGRFENATCTPSRRRGWAGWPCV